MFIGKFPETFGAARKQISPGGYEKTDLPDGGFNLARFKDAGIGEGGVQFAIRVAEKQWKEANTAGEEIIRLRRDLVPKLSPLARLAYRRIAHDAEELRIEYLPSVKNDFAVELAQSRAREKTFRATLVGPHRDDLQLLQNEKSAAQFGSEGQKRTLAIALKMAQAEYLAGIHGSAPVLLIDDVMGELDVKRRSGFLPLLEQARKTSGQVFMTATGENWPAELGKDLQRWEVRAGALLKK